MDSILLLLDYQVKKKNPKKFTLSEENEKYKRLNSHSPMRKWTKCNDEGEKVGIEINVINIFFDILCVKLTFTHHVSASSTTFRIGAKSGKVKQLVLKTLFQIVANFVTLRITEY